MATINGTWVFNLVLSKPNFEFYQSGVNFGIDGLSEPVAAIIYYLETNGAYTGNRLWYRGGLDGFPDGDINMVYNFDTNTWTDTKFRTISFSGYEELGEEFAAWFTANATKQTEEEKPKPKIATFDLSTLYLESAEHTVTVKSKRKYYNDSENSNSVIYGKDLLYELSQDGSYYKVIGIGNYDKTDVVIPSLYKGLPISIIGEYAFQLDSITSVIIGSNVTTIELGAFFGCTSLKSVTIGDIVTSIGSSAFQNCTSLTSVTIGYRVEEIAGSAFFNCSSLKNIKIGTSVRSIGEHAFESCSSLTSLTIPESTVEIYQGAFYGCESLNSVTFEGNDMVWYIMNYENSYNKPVNVSNKEQNAIYLKNTYVDYKWEK